MSPEAQRIAIAEACGADTCAGSVNAFWPREAYSTLRALHCCPFFSEERPGKVCAPLPDYLNDLNAMHEAEKTIFGPQWTLYREKLATLGYNASVHTTAAQRCEAFLRTLNLWTDTP